MVPAKNWLPLILVASSMALFAEVSGELSDDGHVLTVDVSGAEAFDPALLSSAVTNLVKAGNGLLTVSADLSSWTGRVTVSQGTYKATIPSALGDVTTGRGGVVEIADGATLELVGDGTQFTMPKKAFIIGGTGVSGRGAVVYSGSGTFDKASLGNDISVRSDALVSVEGDFHVYWNNSPTFIRLNGNVLTLMPYASRSFILGYANTPDPQGGRIVVDGNTLSLMNPNAAVTGDGCVTVTNAATFEFSTLKGTFDWMVDFAPGCALRTKAKIDGDVATTNVNVFGGAVSLGDPNTTARFAYDSNPGGSVSFRGKVSGGGFSVTRDVRVTNAQFHLFNPGNDFTNGVAAASGIDVYLWRDGALPSAGGPLSLVDGGLYLLPGDYYQLPSANFDGETTICGGIGNWNGAVRKTGNGALVYNSGVDGSLLSVESGMARFCATNRAKIAGLYEGRYVYRKNTRPDYTDFFSGKNFPTNSIAAGTMCSYDSAYALWDIPDVAGSDTRSVMAYKGYLWNNSSEPVVWAFAGSEANTVHLEIGGTVVYEQTYNTGGTKYIGHGRATLQPGANLFLYVVYVGGLSGGPNAWFSDGTAAAQGNWKNNFGLAVNKGGSDSLVVSEYEPLLDPGDGSVFTYALPDDSSVVRPGVATPPSDRNGMMPDFHEMAFAPGTGVDFGGVNDYCIEAISGLPSVSGVGRLTIASEWKVDVAEFGNGSCLSTVGAIDLSNGLRMSVANSSAFKSVVGDLRYPIAQATGAIALGRVSVVPDAEGLKFKLEVADGGGTLYLVRKPKTFVLIVR